MDAEDPQSCAAIAGSKNVFESGNALKVLGRTMFWQRVILMNKFLSENVG